MCFVSGPFVGVAWGIKNLWLWGRLARGMVVCAYCCGDVLKHLIESKMCAPSILVALVAPQTCMCSWWAQDLLQPTRVCLNYIGSPPNIGGCPL